MTELQYLAALLRYFGLNEAVRTDQSYEALREELRVALNLWGGRPANDLRVAWTFSDRIIAYYWIDTPGEFTRHAYEIAWRRDENGQIIFSDPIAVKEIETYEPIAESAKPNNKGQRLTETIDQTLTITEAQVDAKGARRVKAIGITADVVNGNGRRYPRRVLADAVAKLNSHLHESNGQGKLIATGEAEHPSDKGGRSSILETVVKWEAASLDSTGKVLLEGVILPTTKGKDIQVLVENGVPVGVSMRGFGESMAVREDGQAIQEVTDLTIRGFDLVQQPSDPNGAITEAQQQADTSKLEATKVNEEEKKVLEEANRKAAQELAEAKQALADQAKQLEEAQKAQAELAERKVTEAIDRAITEATKDLKYGDAMNKLFVEAVRAAKPASPEAVKEIVEAKRKEYDAISAGVRLNGLGRDVQVTGPVFEQETGQPQFTRPAWELNEALIKAGEGPGEGVRRDLRDNNASRAARFAAATLERFDALHKPQLLAESRLFEEAEQTSDLNLPYSIARMLIEQAYPELVSANVYDFGVTDVSPAKIYYEAYAGESGASAAVTDAAVTASTTAWADIGNKRLRPGTVTVTNSGGGTTYVEGTDYVIDYEEGKLWVLATITNGQSLLVDYTYDLFRKGEMAPIQRMKNTMTSTTLEMAADRLATQISKEAMVFSRSQLNYDAVTRTLGNLAKLVNRKIDSDIFRKGLAYALKQANNSGGTWTAASDGVDVLAKYLGIAKVKVHTRYYVPTAFVMSPTNADRISNWADGFKRDGFPNAVLNAAGFAGSIKGLPIYTSTEYPDAYIQVVNRELVAHQVFQPMTFHGPFPSYDSNGLLVGADQYYAEEFNGSAVLVEQKTAYVKVA